MREVIPLKVCKFYNRDIGKKLRPYNSGKMESIQPLLKLGEKGSLTGRIGI